MTETSNLTDQLLIAMPAMGDPNFAHTVTYMCQHSTDGALGIIVNRPIDMKLGDIMKQMEIEVIDEKIDNVPVYAGGPVQTERGFILHNPVGQWDSSLPVSDDLALTTSRDILAAIAKGEGPENVLIALGYAGWSAGQLESEIVANAWLNSPAQKSILFDLPSDQRWKAAAEEMGIDIDQLSYQVGHA